MDRADLAARLAAASDAERATLLAGYAVLADSALAQALKTLYFDTIASDPQLAAGAAAALSTLAHVNDSPEIQALAAWTRGLAALQIEGQSERAIQALDEAAARFEAIDQHQTAAATQVSKIHALAMLGRYDEAIDCGLRARDTLLRYDDTLSAGKIELNLGNIYHRRDQYHEAEQLYHAARERFAAVGDERLMIYADNGLANILSLQHNFRAAAQLYEQALARAEAAGLEVTRAEIECNLGSLKLFQGHYDRALAYLEQSRRRYAELEMPHESAIAELELADAYLELNLAPEAAAIYTRAGATFAELEMRAEQARTLLNHGRARLLLGEMEQARELLAEAHRLYHAEGNTLGVAQVRVAEAQLAYAAGSYAVSAEAAAAAEATVAQTGAVGQRLFARWLRGEATRALGLNDRDARRLLESALQEADERGVPAVAQRCYTSLGLMAKASDDIAGAESAFKSAVVLIEAMRAPLPADEFRAAFASDKRTPYTELVQICLADKAGGRVAEAFDYVERERSRALVEMLHGAIRLPTHPRDPLEARLIAQLEGLRTDLNWFYSQINRPPDDDTSRLATIESLYQSAREREAQIAEIQRQLQQHDPSGQGGLAQFEALEIEQIQRDLGPDTALVEYYALDGELLALVVTDEGVEVERGLGKEEAVTSVLEQFRFQIGTLLYGVDRVRTHLSLLTARTQHHLVTLYDMLLRPIEGRLGARRLVVVPYHALHYVPFHALHDGESYLIERREICYAPSAGLLHHCHRQPRRPLRHALLLGMPDERIPLVRHEVEALAPLFASSSVLVDGQATRAALREQAQTADVVHLACHGQFRPDSPLFSSLQLADGWLTVRDAYDLQLHCQLVTLSGCETGVSAISPGDDLIGLARGFFSAGAATLLVSLWTVDDESTAACMTLFYQQLRTGAAPAAALRHAQRTLLEHHPHPFFWSPFVLLGRW